MVHLKYAMRKLMMQYATAWALGNMYLILRQDVVPSRHVHRRMAFSNSGVKPFPLRTDSMILKARARPS
jgi:hypothetical protein